MIRKTIAMLLALSFTLGIHHGQLALWRTGQILPETLYPLSVSMLPKEMQQRLHEGITIEDETALKALLEDLLS